MRFTDPFAAANVGTPLHIDLHPTQLYEAGAELLILGLLLGTERTGRPFAGRTFWAYMCLYGISRFIIEMFRGDPRGFVFGTGLSTSQFIADHPGAAQPDHAVRAVAAVRRRRPRRCAPPREAAADGRRRFIGYQMTLSFLPSSTDSASTRCSRRSSRNNRDRSSSG